MTRLRGGYGRGNGTIWKLGSLLVLWSLHGEAGVSLNPETQATPSTWNQASKLRTVHRWIRSSERNKGQWVSKPTLLAGSHYREHNCFKSFKASIPIRAGSPPGACLRGCTVASLILWLILTSSTPISSTHSLLGTTLTDPRRHLSAVAGSP